MIYEITELLGLTDASPQLKELALLFNDVETALLNKAITTQEYVGLMEDIERLRQIIAVTAELELNIKINTAVKGLITLAQSAKII